VQRLGVPDEVRSTFVRAAVAGFAGFAGFAVLGFFTAVSPLFVGQVLHEPRHLVTGLVVFTLLGSSAAGQLLSARLPERTSLLGGCLALAAGVVVVAVGLATALLPVLVVGALVAGLGQGASFRAGLQAVPHPPSAAARSRRASSSSSTWPSRSRLIGVGAGAQVFGLVPTAVVFAGLVAALALAAFVSLLRRG
jgi:hypothetical protein